MGDGGGAVGGQSLHEIMGPVDLEAERAVLAAVLLDARGEEGVLWRVRALVRSADFSDPRHALVFEAMCTVGDRGEDIDITTMAAELRRRERLNTVGGAQALGDLTDEIPTLAHVESHARLVADAARVRRSIDAARQLIVRAARGARSEELLGSARAVMDAASADAEADLLPLDAGLEEEVARMASTGTPAGLTPTGLASVDAALAGGLWAGQLVVLGARPAVGKSALALLWACEAAARGEGVVVFVSLEMPRRDLAMRCAALWCAADPAKPPVDLMAVRERKLSTGDAQRYARALDDLRGLPLLLCDRPSVTVVQVRAMALRAKARAGRVALVVVDYLQLLRPETARDSREREVAEASRALKALAGELGCPVVALSQLNRKATERKPTLADLRESGAIEQDADVVILLHRDEDGVAAHIEKQRNGVAPTEVRLGWCAPAARFTEAAQRPAWGGRTSEADHPADEAEGDYQ
jgi:replicative DNA helicase